MANKVIPFPQSTPGIPQPVINHQNRVILHIGRQRIALDISCRATELNSEPAPIVMAAPITILGGKGHKAPKP